MSEESDNLSPAPEPQPPEAPKPAHKGPARGRVTEHKRGGLGELASTAICGNDITSSCLYVSALCILAAGKWAPVALLFVAFSLYLFRAVYSEVVGALPLNGGAYNALLNTTSKSWASLAACLTLLSYMATAVISAAEATHYAHSLWHDLPVLSATIALLAIFMVLTIIGIGESAKVAIGIFILHMVSLTLLLIAGGLLLLKSGTGILLENFSAPSEIGMWEALFFGFAAAMLGISGFESSANFVEEQAEGVFPKTLRNMWFAVSFFNPMMALLALSLVRIPEVEQHSETLLAHLGKLAGGPWLATLISVDAALVLSGAVLTSFIGVTGLVRRMTLDRCLPQALLKTNSRGTSHRIIMGFFVLSASVMLATGGHVKTIAGVYTISFLSVMCLFALGNILLKVKRARLPRPVHASWFAVLGGLAAVLTGLAGNVLKLDKTTHDISLNTEYLKVFFLYFGPAVIIIVIMLTRIGILKALLFFVHNISQSVLSYTEGVMNSLKGRIDLINSQQVVYWTRGDNAANLNAAAMYVRLNEQTNRLKVAIVVQDESEIPEDLRSNLDVIDQMYPEIDIKLAVIKGRMFGPELVHEYSRRWNVPTNFMFIGSPGDHFIYGLAELGGVRLII